MNKKLLSGAALALGGILFLGLNIVSNATLQGVRLDLTQNKLYTLSEGTKKILGTINEPITLRFFYSEKLSSQLPQLKPYATRVRELLEQYKSLSKGMVRLEVIDPEPFSEAEDRATQAGIQGVPLDQSTNRAFYFGLSGSNSTDRVEVIPFFQQDKEQLLEYDLTKLVYNLNTLNKPKIGVIGDLPLEFGPGGIMAAMRGQAQPYLLYQQLKDRFEIAPIKSDTAEIDPKEIGVLLIAHPKSINDQQQYAIDQFVLKGGRALIFVDPLAESAAQQPGPTGIPNLGEQHSSNLKKLFDAWGIEMAEGQFVADSGQAIRVASGETQRRQAVDYVAWLAVQDENKNKADVITGELGPLNIASAGALKARDGATTEITPLLTSSGQAELVSTEKIRFRPRPEELLAELKPTGQHYILAARLTGQVKTAFPDGPPAKKQEADAEKAEKKDESKTNPAPQVMASQNPINVVIVADTDMLEDRFWVRVQDFFGQRVGTPIASNADFVVNALDNLQGSNDLISLRSRGRSNRPFDVVDNLRRQAGISFLNQEQALQRRLEETEKQITELQSKSKGGQGNALLSGEERSAIEGFRTELAKTRKELRDVQLKLNQGIERLSAIIKFINIGLVPILVALFAVGLAYIRHLRRKRLIAQRA